MVYINYEIAINHNVDSNIVKKMINEVMRAACNAVKFQKRTIEKIYSKEVLDSPRESPR